MTYYEYLVKIKPELAKKYTGYCPDSFDLPSVRCKDTCEECWHTNEVPDFMVTELNMQVNETELEKLLEG